MADTAVSTTTTLQASAPESDTQDYSQEVMIACLVIIVFMSSIVGWIHMSINKHLPLPKLAQYLAKKLKVDATSSSLMLLTDDKDPLYPSGHASPRTKDSLTFVDQPMGIDQLKRLAIDSDQLLRMYSSVPSNQVRKDSAPRGSEPKNRYRNILPNPYSRVKLASKDDTLESTYINANYVFGRRFIASQGPPASVFDDFWRMIWENEVEVIVMLTNLVESNILKADQYWPDESDGSEVYGDLEVRVETVSPDVEYSVTALQVRNIKTGVTRKVYHFFFQSWPDHGVPDEDADTLDIFLDFMDEIRQQQSRAPILVHCSAGAGRTGCFMAIWAGWKQIETYAAAGVHQQPLAVDPMRIFSQLRKDRGGSIQTMDQFGFVIRAYVRLMDRISEFQKSR